MATHCEHAECGKPLVGRRRDARFCSLACSQRAWYLRQNRAEVIARNMLRKQQVAGEDRYGREVMAACGLKVCRRCGYLKDYESFARSRDRHDGRYPYCRPCANAYQRELREKSPEKYIPKARAAHRRWELADPERYARSRRARKVRRRLREETQFVEHVDPLVVLELDDGACGICGDDVDSDRFEVDHVIPIAHGGEHSYANTQTAHPACNRRKSATVAA
jgi:5-methylcytosine-specific restriction endonuclease McrA